MRIVIAQSDDWEALYINGRLRTGDHRIRRPLLLGVIIGEINTTGEQITTFEEKWVNSDWYSYDAGFPLDISDIVWENEEWNTDIEDDVEND